MEKWLQGRISDCHMFCLIQKDSIVAVYYSTSIVYFSFALTHQIQYNTTSCHYWSTSVDHHLTPVLSTMCSVYVEYHSGTYIYQWSIWWCTICFCQCHTINFPYNIHSSTYASHSSYTTDQYQWLTDSWRWHPHLEWVLQIMEICSYMLLFQKNPMNIYYYYHWTFPKCRNIYNNIRN